MIKCSDISAEALSFLGAMEKRDFSVHSVFAHALNIQCGDDLITILSKGRDVFPLSIVSAEETDFEELGIRQGGLCEVSFSEKRITASDVSFDFSDAGITDCDILIVGSKKISSEKAKPEDVFSRISVIEKFVLQNGNPGGVLPLLCTDGSVQQNIWSAFLKGRTEDLEKDIIRVFRCDNKLITPYTEEIFRASPEDCSVCDRFVLMENHFGKITGAGPGLTPSGDDFITGVLAAVFTLASEGLITRETAGRIGECAALNVKKTNTISGSFIKQASRGCLSRSIIELSLSLFKADCSENELLSKATRVLDFGSSSGTDILTGFLFASYAFYKAYSVSKR